MIQALLLALLAAAGNAIFVFGQKKAVGVQSIGFVAIATAVATICLIVVMLMQPGFIHELKSEVRTNLRWGAVSGFGLAVTYIGFYWLYTRFGASYYVLYAVLSILSTAILVGVVIFHEPFGTWRWLSLILAIASVICFSLGQSR